MVANTMKSHNRQKLFQKQKLNDPFAIPRAEWPSPKAITEIVAAIGASSLTDKNPKTSSDLGATNDILQTLVSIATNAWRAKVKMVDHMTGEVREDMKRVDRHIEAIYRNLTEVGIVIRDHTGEAYDEGQPMKVIASKPTQGLQNKRVSETLLPSIFWRDRLIQNGEIEIAAPLATEPTVGPQTQTS